jgi:hypothetical protein
VRGILLAAVSRRVVAVLPRATTGKRNPSKLINQLLPAQVNTLLATGQVAHRNADVPDIISIPFLSSLLATDANLST